MCLLSYYPPGVMPNREHLENGAVLNPHGHGYGLSGPRRLMRGRSLNAQLEIVLFEEIRKEYPETHAIFHSRFASATEPCVEHAQPMISEWANRKLLVAHNGYLFTSPDGRSDSQVFAEDILPMWCVFEEAKRRELEELIFPSKMIILAQGDEPVFLNKDLGITLPDGTWHSNQDYTGVSLSPPAGHCRLCHVLSETAICPDCEQRAETRREILLG